MDNIQDYHERLKAIREDLNLKPRQMAIMLGVDPAQYYRTEKGTYKLPQRANDVLSTQKGVNLNWLLTGIGSRYINIDEKESSSNSSVSESDQSVYKTSDGLTHQGLVHRVTPGLKSISGEGDEVPYFDFDFIMGDGVGFADGNAETPAYTMKIQGFPHCISFPTFGDSMERLIKSGSIVFARLIEWKDYVEYGQIYGIVMRDNRRFLKYIRRSPENDKTHFLLRSENDQYDDFEIPKTHVQKIWLIEGWINRAH